MNATFEVVKVDPNGSGTDFSGHKGAIVKNAKRCCKNCSVIFGDISGTEVGPFVLGELRPLNNEGNLVLKEILEWVAENPSLRFV